MHVIRCEDGTELSPYEYEYEYEYEYDHDDVYEYECECECEWNYDYDTLHRRSSIIDHPNASTKLS